MFSLFAMSRIFCLWCLMLLPCLADGLDDLNALSHVFGRPTEGFGSGGFSFNHEALMRTNFTYNGMTITALCPSDSVNVEGVIISRDTAFNSLEIPDILKMLSSSGDWTQKGDSDWTLSNSRIKAHWNGENRIVVGSVEADLPPRGTGSYGK